jgi:hypothetical protein
MGTRSGFDKIFPRCLPVEAIGAGWSKMTAGDLCDDRSKLSQTNVDIFINTATAWLFGRLLVIIQASNCKISANFAY